MEWGTVSAASMAGMIFSLLVSVGLPVILAVMIRKKLGAQMKSLFVGAGIFVCFAMVLEQILHTLVFSAAGTALTSNVFLYALYGGLAAALFEEAGRYIAMRFFMKNALDRDNALMYGVGHGGIEAILLMGMASVNNLLISAMINNGGISEVMSQMDAETARTTYEQLTALWQSPSYMFYMGGLERLSALALQIGLSLFMFRAVKEGRKGFLLLAFGTHFLVDFLTVIAAGTLSTAVLEILLLIASAAVLGYALWVCRKKEDTVGHPAQQ